MHTDPFTELSEKHGCGSCGRTGNVFYVVKYYILPTKLVRKRHRDKSRIEIYCRDCFEANPSYSFEANGTGVSVPRKPRQLSDDPASRQCTVCRQVPDWDGLYGVLTSPLFMDGSMIENFPVARLCSGCVELQEISLPQSLDV